MALHVQHTPLTLPSCWTTSFKGFKRLQRSATPLPKVPGSSYQSAVVQPHSCWILLSFGRKISFNILMKYVSSPELVTGGKTVLLHTSQWVLTSAEPFMTHCCPENTTRNNTSDLLFLCLKPCPQVGHHFGEWRSYFWPCWAKGGSAAALVFKLYFTPRVTNNWYKYSSYGAPPSQQSSLFRTSLSKSFSYQSFGVKKTELLVSCFQNGPCTKLSLVVQAVPSLSTINAPPAL